jgi:hypothetical protein
MRQGYRNLAAVGRKKGSKVFFSEEKKQKTLANSGVGAA